MHKRLDLPYRYALLVSSLLAACAVYADDDDLFEMELAQLLQISVTTASRLQESLQQAPGTVVVLTRQQLRERGYLNLLEVLQDLPGVDVQQYTDDKFYNRIAFRGLMGNNRFVILRNGHRTFVPRQTAGNRLRSGEGAI